MMKGRPFYRSLKVVTCQLMAFSGREHINLSRGVRQLGTQACAGSVRDVAETVSALLASPAMALPSPKDMKQSNR
jgi:hypothetical protein